MPHATGPDQHHGQSDRVQALCHGLGLRIITVSPTESRRSVMALALEL